MTDQDPDARHLDPEAAPPSDADLVLDAQPVFEPDATAVADPGPTTPATDPDDEGGTGTVDSPAPEEAPVEEHHPASPDEDTPPDPSVTAPSVVLPEPVGTTPHAGTTQVDGPARPTEPTQPEGAARSGEPARSEDSTLPDAPAEPVVLPTTLEPAAPVEVAETVEVIAPVETSGVAAPASSPHVAEESAGPETETETAPSEPEPEPTEPEPTAPVAHEPPTHGSTVHPTGAAASDPHVPSHAASHSEEAPTPMAPAAPATPGEPSTGAPSWLATAPAPTGAPQSSPQATEEETTTSSHHIPVVPIPDPDVETGAPSSTTGEDTSTDLPPDVLGNRSTHHQAATGTPDAVEDTAPRRTSIMPAAAPADPEDELDQTQVHRRSFVAPPQEPSEEGGEAQWRPRSDADAEGERPSATPKSLDDALFEGATVVPEVPSRAAAHVWSLLLSIVLVPLGWYLLADAGARMTLATDNPMSTGVLNPAALLELLGGLLVVWLVVLLARHSSLGAHVVGIVVTVVGIPWVVAPGVTARAVLPALDWLDQWNSFGANLAHHLQASGYSGRLLLLGVVLLLIGWTSHRVRRSGREEEALRAEVARVNPQGAHLTWRERRRAARAAGER